MTDKANLTEHLETAEESAPLAPQAAPTVTPAPERRGAADLDGMSGPRQFPAVTNDAIRHAFEAGHYPYPRMMGRVSYETDKAKLQAELLKLQIWTQETGEKFILLFEGRDAVASVARSSDTWSI